MHVAAANPLALNSSEINDDLIKKEEKLISEKLENIGKTPELQKISLGKINKFKEK